MKNNETKCKDVLRWQCVLRCYFVPSKTFSRNKTYKIVHLVPLKTFSRNKMRGTSDFSRLWREVRERREVTRLATLRVPFLCSLPEGPLHASWSSRPEAVGLFPLKTLQERTPDGLQKKKPGAMRRASWRLRREGDSNSWYPLGVYTLSRRAS